MLVALLMATGPAAAESQADASVEVVGADFAEPDANVPGWMSVKPEPVTPEQARAYYESSAAPAIMQAAGVAAPMAFVATAPETLPEIVALARALQHDPKLIYEFVHNHIDYVPYYGSMKGPLLTLLDRSGNDFDQAALMVALLRASSQKGNNGIITAQFVFGTITYPAFGATDQRDLQHWLSVDPDASIISQVFAAGGFATYQAAASMEIDRVWVRATIGGPVYIFDPAFKTYTETTSISLADLSTAIGYTRADLLAAAGGTGDANYVQNINEGNLNTKLASYTTNLVNYLRTNHPNKETAEIIGGREIVPEFLAQLPTSLPFPPSTTTITVDDIPDAYIHTVRIQHGQIDQTLKLPDIAGHKLAMTYDAPTPVPVGGTYDFGVITPSDTSWPTKTFVLTATAGSGLKISWASGNSTCAFKYQFNNNYKCGTTSIGALYPGTLNIPVEFDGTGQSAGTKTGTLRLAVTNPSTGSVSHFDFPCGGRVVTSFPRAQLWLDDTIIAEETGTITGPLVAPMTITFDHHYPAKEGTYANTPVGNYKLTRGSTYALVSEFGGSEPGLLLEERQRKLSELRASGLADTSREVMTESLNVIGQTWMKQTTLSEKLLGELTDIIDIRHHRFGVAAASQNFYYVDIRNQQSTQVARHSDQTDANGPFLRATGFMASAMEHGVLEQLQGLDRPAVSTVRLMHLANQAGNKIFLANRNNWDATVSPQLTGYDAYKTFFRNRLFYNDGVSLLLPSNYPITSGNWSGMGYVDYQSIVGGMGIGMIIDGGVPGALYGAYAIYLNGLDAYKLEAFTLPKNDIKSQNYQFESAEPVNLATGAYLYDHEDLSLGGAEPNGLHFTRSYNSDNRNSDVAGLGHGWNHGYNIQVKVHSDVESGMGQRAPVDAAALIVSTVATIDLMRLASPSDTIPGVKNWVTALFTANWAMDQLGNNAASIRVHDKALTYIKLPDASFNPPPGVTTNLSYTTGATYPYKLTERFGTMIDFNSDNTIHSWTDADGNSMSFTYASGKLNTVTDSKSRTLTLAYTGDYLTKVTDSTSRYVGYTQTSGNLTTFTDAEQKSWGYGYDPGTGHRIITVSDPLGLILATNTYDSLNDVDTQTYPRYGGSTIEFKYYFSGLRNVEEDPEGDQTVYFLDRAGRTTAVQDALGNAQATVFDGQNHPVKTIDPRGNQTQYSYDGMQNLQFVTNALNQQTENVYDPKNRLQDTYDPLRHVTHFEYSTTNHLLLTRDALGNEFKSTYNTANPGRGLPKDSTDALNIKTTYTYDIYGNPDHTQVAAHPIVDQGYDAIGRRTQLIDQENATTSFIYNNLNLVTSITDPQLKSTILTYDNVGRLQLRKDRNDATITYAYTPSGKMRLIDYPTGTDVNFTFTTDWEKVETMTDSLGTTNYYYDNANRLTSQRDPNAFTVGYDYDAAGNLTKLTYPGTNKTVSYTYDALNRMKTVKINWLNQTAEYFYDDAGRLDYLVSFNGATTDYSYDNANRLTGIAHTNGGTTIAAVQFPELDGNGNRKQEVRTEAQPPPAPVLESQSYTYNASKTRLQSAGADTFGYDNEGQTTTKGSTNFTWDYEHRLTSVNGTAAQYSYDGAGNRLKAVRGGVTTKYVYDQSGNLLAETNNAGAITRYYIHGLGMLAFVEGNSLYVYHHDAVGNTMAVTDGAGVVKNAYAYTPYGRVTDKQEAIAQPFQFAGQFGVMTEENGLFYMRARYYDPKIGRFLSEDPIGFDGGLNLYAYVGGNPISGVDPSGLWRANEHGAYAGFDIGWTNPMNPFSTGLHFRSLTDVQPELDAAIVSGDRKAYMALMHQGQDSFSHYDGGYRGLLTLGHLLDWVIGDDADSPTQHRDAFEAMQAWTAQMETKWKTSNK